MDAPFDFTFDQGYAASEYYTPSSTTNYITARGSLVGPPSSQYSSIFNEDLCNGASQAHPALQLNSSVVMDRVPAGAAATQSTCKLQPRVYSRSPSLTRIYAPPPSGQVVQLQSYDQPFCFQHHVALNRLRASSLPLHDADAVHPIPRDVFAFNKPPPAPSCTPISYGFDADTNVLYCKGKQLPKHDPFPCSFSHEDTNHKDMNPYHHALHDSPYLASPNRPSLQCPVRSRRPPKLDVSTSPAPCGAMDGGNASPAYVQSDIFSLAAAASASLDSSAMEMSTTSAPPAVPTSNSSLYSTAMPSENGSLIVPASPTLLVNKGGRTIGKRLCGSATSGVAFKVKTTLLNLHDNFKWNKYGEKHIIGWKSTRSYFKCNEKARCGCKVVKRTQKCNDGELIIFAYLGGRHNHP